MRSEELQQERKMNSELVQRVERIYYLESELGKARQRVEEMNLVVQNKMVAEKELIDMSEALANDLSKSRQEVLSLRHKLENKQYLHNKTVGAVTSMQQHEQRQPCSMSSDYYSLTESGSMSSEMGQNSHRKARYYFSYDFFWQFISHYLEAYPYILQLQLREARPISRARCCWKEWLSCVDAACARLSQDHYQMEEAQLVTLISACNNAYHYAFLLHDINQLLQ